MSSQYAELPTDSTGLQRLWLRGKRRFATLYRYRMLVYNLVLRDLKARYRDRMT